MVATVLESPLKSWNFEMSWNNKLFCLVHELQILHTMMNNESNDMSYIVSSFMFINILQTGRTAEGFVQT